MTQADRSHPGPRLANIVWGHARVTFLIVAAALIALPVGAFSTKWLNLGITAYFLAVLSLGITLDRRAA